jgi:hypothetical protein
VALFTLGGIAVAAEAVVGFAQSYEPLGGVARLRMMSGAAVQQVHWRRLRTVLSGDGWWPAGLDGLDYDAQLTLACAAPRSIRSASNVIVLPAGRRADAGYTPIGHALLTGAGTQVGGGDLVPTPVSMGGDTATLTVVSGAAGYQVTWWPVLIVFADPPTAETDARGATHRWSLTAEEV